jgi:hypothetical protein
MLKYSMRSKLYAIFLLVAALGAQNAAHAQTPVASRTDGENTHY